MARRSKVPPDHELKLSSVKVHPHVLSLFQEQAIHKITFQSLVNRSLHLYSSNEDFRKVIISCTDLIPSGSL